MTVQMQQPLVCLGCVILLLCPAVVSPGGVAGGGESGGIGHAEPALDGTEATVSATPVAAQVAPLEPDAVVLSVSVYENGTAQWRIEYRTRLDDPARREAFQRFQADLDDGAGSVDGGFYRQINASIAAAENATGREMTGTGFATDAAVRRLPQEYGVVVYRFRWRGFAAVSEEGLRVGDALAGFFLGEGERLLLSWPRGYQLSEIQPEPDSQRDRTVVWQGPREFDPSEPRVLLTERAWPGSELLRAAGAATVLGAGALLFWLLRRGPALPSVVPGLLERGQDGSELLSNEEQVLDLLERRGGRVKQQVIADELGWTETKTSYVVSNLREQGRIDSFRLGRENVLSLAESDPDDGRA